MRIFALISVFLMVLAALPAKAVWYLPFISDYDDSKGPRLSELMEPATTNIDAAADFAAEGKITEAVESYRAALAALDLIEKQNPERAATAEFATLRNKRAYVNAAIDSMLLAQARNNAKAVAVTDTTELEKKMRGGKNPPKLEKQIDAYMEEQREHKKKVLKAAEKAKMAKGMQRKIDRLLEDDPDSRKARMMQAGEWLRKGETAKAKEVISKLLAEKPNDPAALNLRAACEAAEGDLMSAEWTLEQAIEYNPDEHHAYRNLAALYRRNGDAEGAKRMVAKADELEKRAKAASKAEDEE